MYTVFLPYDGAALTDTSRFLVQSSKGDLPEAAHLPAAVSLLPVAA